MDARSLVIALALGILTTVSLASTGAPPQAIREFDLTVTQLEDGSYAYNGQVPGPTLDVHVGDTIVLRLTNTLSVPVSFHVHGTDLTVENDGIPEHEGTLFVPSVAQPGETRTYTMRASYFGTWHYHDHAVGQDGAEGTRRGLYGALLVRNGAEPTPPTVLDLHLLNAGPNADASGPRGLDATIPIGSDADIAVVGLGDLVWDVTLRDPAGALVGSATIAPGISERFHIENAVPGAYTWRAASFPFPAVTGTVRAQ